MPVRMRPAGERGMVVELGESIDPETNAAVRALAAALESGDVPGLRELVPTYRSLGVEYDPEAIGWEALAAKILAALETIERGGPPPGRVVEIPTRYGGEHGPDLADVAVHAGLSPEEVVRLHAGTEYPVYMLGFTAGFAYLGGLPEALHTPRLASPRTRVPRGSVGIGGGQTGVYPAETPGGWRLIGRTPLSLFDPHRDPPTPIRPGDRVRFAPIGEAEYRRLERERAAAARAAAAADTDVPERPLFEVVLPGPLTTVQDLGRAGYQQLGLPRSGAVDPLALRVGNTLLGNPDGAAGLEFTGVGPTLAFAADRVVALTGGPFAATLDGRAAPWYASFLVRAGQTLEIGGMCQGFRGYLAVAGGIEVPRLLGSAATCLPACFGGHQGRRLEVRDRLRAGATGRTALVGCTAEATLRQIFDEPAPVRIVLGPQEDAFTAEGRQTFLSSVYRVTHEADRMGCRLAGPAIAHTAGADVISDWIPPGGIQVPGNGTPIVLLSDRQTTGGYAKLATVIGPDIGRIAQCRPGDPVRFRAVSVSEAQQVARAVETALSRLPGSMLRALQDCAPDYGC